MEPMEYLNAFWVGGLICVIGSEEKIEECREMFGEVRTLS